MLNTSTFHPACLSEPKSTEAVKSLMENNLLESIQVNSVLAVLLQALSAREQDAPILNTIMLLTEVVERLVKRNKQLISIIHSENESTPFLYSSLLDQAPNTKLGTRIRETRKLLSLTQKQIAELVGVTPSCVTQWESGIVYPNCDKLIPLAKALGCDPLWLISGN